MSLTPAQVQFVEQGEDHDPKFPWCNKGLTCHSESGGGIGAYLSSSRKPGTEGDSSPLRMKMRREIQGQSEGGKAEETK